ncbi:MAG: hypothetical protein ACLT8A_08130, partial [Subdoligranulum sp.]
MSRDLDARRCEVTVEAAVVGAESVTFTLDGQQTNVAVKDGNARAVFTLEHTHLWDGLDDPYLYTVTARLDNGETETARFGCRKFEIDPQKGFILNGRPYPLRGVSRHQDRKGGGCGHHQRDDGGGHGADPRNGRQHHPPCPLPA